MREDYDKKIRLRKKSIFCYSVKNFKKISEELQPEIIGEIIENSESQSDEKILIGSGFYSIHETGSKSRLIYSVAGYIQLDDGSFVTVLKSRIPLFITGVFSVAVLSAVLTIVFLRINTPPAVKPLPPDPGIGVIEGDDSEKNESENGGGAVRLTYSLDAKLSLSTGSIKIYFLNPNASNRDISITLYLLDGENKIKIAESGLIPSGYGLTNMTFIKNSAELSHGNYNALFIVSFYDPDTGEKALVEASVTDVKLQVLP